MGEAHGTGDPYSRVDYRRMIAWERRIRREGPLLQRLLAEAPEASVVDLGCGTGEHVAYFAERGVRAIGIDRSPAMIEAARTHEAAGNGRFLLGEAADAPALLEGEAPFGLVLCLGNVLPHVSDEGALGAWLRAAHELLLPGGIFLIQLLNYERILAEGVRHLPLDVRAGDGGEEIVFLRLLRAEPDGHLLFFPTTLVLDADAEEPVRVQASKRIRLRAWTRAQLEPALEAAGFSVRWHGDVEGGTFAERQSTDLVAVARRVGEREPAAG